MKNLIRLGLSIPLLFIVSYAHASYSYPTRILVSRKSCPVQTAALEVIQALPAAFPQGWTIVVTCTDSDWRYLQLKADAIQTEHAFTSFSGKMTVIRGDVFVNPPPFRPARLILLHELGHITCQCGNENNAEDWARKLNK